MDRKTAKTLKKEVKKHFDSIKDETTIRRIFNEIDPLRKRLDKTDNNIVNAGEEMVRKSFARNYRKQCVLDLYDILDWSVKKYSNEQTRDVTATLERVKNINDRNFWEKLIAVFSGS